MIKIAGATVSTRQTAGLSAKLDGHRMEDALASALGVKFIRLDGTSKTDLFDTSGKYRISLKNSDSAHTQVALISQRTLAEFLEADYFDSSFIKLFFGFADHSKLTQQKLDAYRISLDSLDEDSEIYRNRLVFNNIPTSISSSFMKKINSRTQSGTLMQKLVAGDANVLAWVSQKNSTSGVRYARMQDVLAVLSAGKWEVADSGSVLNLFANNVKVMYVQMKGSSKRYSPGYHSCMFHLYRSVMDLADSKEDLTDLAI